MSNKDETTILYVDDEEINLFLFKMLFVKQFNIQLTVSPIEALEIVKNPNIKIVLTDYKMPVMDGVELITKIKEIRPDIKCFLISGMLKVETEISSNLLEGYIAKPWGKDEMLNTLKTALE